MCTYLQVEVFIEEKPKRHSYNAKSEKPQDEVDREHQELWDGFGNKKERTEPTFGYQMNILSCLSSPYMVKTNSCFQTIYKFTLTDPD